MGTRTMKVAAVAGAVAALAIGFCMAGGGGKPSARAHRLSFGGASAPLASAARSGDTSAARPGGAVAVPAPAIAPAASSVESESVIRARELLQRLRRAIGPTTDLPEELRRDLVAFLTEGEGSRNSLFRLAWEPAMPRAVVGHLRLLILALPDGSAREALLAAFDSFDPNAGLRAELAAKSKDAPGLASELRAMPAGKARTDRIANLSKETSAEPDVAAMLLEVARADADETARGAAYNRLAYAGVPEVLPILASFAGIVILAGLAIVVSRTVMPVALNGSPML